MGITRRTLLKGTAAISAAGTFGFNPLHAQGGVLIKKAIPKSGEEIPVVGIGTNRYSVGDSEQERKPLRDTLRRFNELGGSVIDTAPAYRRSEAVLGDLINDLGIQDELFMATKCDLRGGNATRQQVDESYRRLKWEAPIDLDMVHSLKSWRGQLPVLRELKQAGRLRYIGITTSRQNQHTELGDIMEKEDIDFVQLNYALNDRNAEQRLLPIAFDKGIAVMANLPFGRGRLFGAVGDRALPAWTSEFDCHSWGQFFLKYVVSHPAVTVAIPGTRKVHHVEDNMGASMGALPDATQRKRMEAFFAAL